MRAGKLRNRLAFQGAFESAAVNGERSKTWTTRTTVWGSVEPLTSKELFTAQQVAPRATHRVTVRGNPVKPTTKERILWGTRVFHIEAPPLDKDEAGVLVSVLVCEVPQ